MHGGHRSPLDADRERISNLGAQLGKCEQRRVQAQPRMAREYRYADFLRTEKSHVRRAQSAPTHFHASGPRGDAIVPAEGVARVVAGALFQMSPAPDERAL